MGVYITAERGAGSFLTVMQGTLVYLTLWVTEQFSGEWMTSFLGFKLKGSSSLELKTDLCMLWNEQSAHSVHGPFYSIKQEEVKNYSDGKNVAPCNSYNYSIPYHHFLTLLDLANASTHIVKKKKKFSRSPWRGVSYFNSYWATPYLREIATLCAF